MGLEKLGITELNAMQLQAGEAIRNGREDVVILSPTGSGKTLAYMLPLVELVDAQSEQVQALVVVPGRELALQSDRLLKDLSTGLRSAACYGGRTAMEEHRKLKEVKPQVVFGTPGRLNDHLDKGNISAYGVRILVIDEFDKCLEMGFRDEMTKLLRKLPGVRRRVLLSATDAEQIPDFIEMSRTCSLNYLKDDGQIPERIQLYAVKSPVKDKLETLKSLLYRFGEEQTIVFLNYRESVERVNNYLQQQGFVTSAFHGGLEQRERENALYRFSNGSANVLVSTDLGSRGLDIPDVQNIIHYHLPLNEEGYIHRVGRTARWDKHGKAYFVVGPEEQMPVFIDGEVENFVLDPAATSSAVSLPSAPQNITLYIGKGKKDKISKGDIVGFLCKKGGLAPQDVGRVDVMDRYAYVAISREKLNQVLRRTHGEKIKGLKTIIETVK